MELNVNQSAVSYTIDKLRHAFNDKLFYRQGSEIVATERCHALRDELTQILEKFDALTEPENFSPETANLTVKIACNHYERQTIFPYIIKELRSQAPGIKLQIVNSSQDGEIQLKKSGADLLIGPLRPNGNEFYCRKLFSEHYVCLACSKDAALGPKLSIKDYVTRPHISVTHGNTWRSKYMIELDAQGLHLNEVIQLPSAASLDLIINDTDLISTLPSRIASTLGNKVKILESPVPAPFDIDLVWTSRTHQSAPHVWLRQLIVNTVNKHLAKDSL
jgi:DNA-binding transcriptional LysR family regulator